MLFLDSLCLELGSGVKLHHGAAVPLPLLWEHPSYGAALWQQQLWPLAALGFVPV